MEKFKKDKTKHDDNSRYKDSKLSIFPLIESIKIYISKSYRNFKADDNRSFTQSYFSDAVKLLLDTYPNASAAYSLRKLSTSYQGPAIRVRRSSDNQEQNFTPTEITDGTLTSFVGSENLIINSESIAGLTLVNVTRTDNNLLAPDGTTTGDTIFETTTNGTHIAFVDYNSAIINQSYTYSVYVKSINGRNIYVNGSNGFSGVNVLINADGSIINSAGTVLVETANYGWYRVSISKIATATTLRLIIYSVEGTNLNFIGDSTKGVGIWGNQLYSGLSVLPYNRTTTGIGGDGHVTTWYDQSGNSRNATQSTAASQPRIVNAGNLVSVNSKAALSFDGVDDKLTNTTLPAASIQSVFYVKKGANLSGNSSVLGFPATLVGNQLGIYYFLGQKCYGFNTWNGDSWGYSNSSSDFLNQTLEMGLFLNGDPSLSGVKLFINNSQKTLSQVLSTSLTRTMGDGFRIGQGGDSSNSQDYDGWQQEVIIWSADYSIVNRVEIQNNINSYYSIY